MYLITRKTFLPNLVSLLDPHPNAPCHELEIKRHANGFMLPQHWRGTITIVVAKKPASTRLLSSDCFNSYAWRQSESRPRLEPQRSSCPRKESERKQRALGNHTPSLNKQAAAVLPKVMFMVAGSETVRKKDGGVWRRWHQRGDKHSQHASHPASVK